jgi:hypothetical protein
MKVHRQFLVLGAGFAVAFSHGVAAQETPAATLAAQIRDQGYACDRALSAVRDAGRSKPDEAVWILKCQNGAYRIRLVPDLAARVTKIR